MNVMQYRMLAWILIIGIQSASAQEAATPWTAQENRLVDRPDEIVAVLENGMTAIVKENHTAPVAAVRLYVRAGSIYEGEYLGAGLSHLFEHLLAGGATKTRTEEQSRQIIQSTGAHYNAFTSKDKACYYLTVPVSHVGTALNLIADWVTRATFPEESFQREWGVVQRELEMGASDPHRQLHYSLDELRYLVHPGRYPVIGYQSIVKQLTRQQVLDYYQKRYIPDHTVIVVVGDINAGEMLAAIKKEFSDFARKASETLALPAEPEVTSPRELVKVLPSMKGPSHLVVGFPSIELQHEDLYALDTLANILGEGESSRLNRSLREEQQVVLSVSSWNYTPHWATGTFAIQCLVEPGKIEAAKAAIWAELEKVQWEGVNPEELERAKRQLQVRHIREHQTAEQQASAMGEDYLATGDAHFSDHYVENMQKVTADQVQQMAQVYFNRGKQLTAVVTGQPLPAAKADAAEAKGETAIRKITLENGLRVLLKRNPAAPLVNAQLFVLGGLLGETAANNGVTTAMWRMSWKGTKDYTARQIADYFDGIGGVYDAQSGNNTYYFTMEVMAPDFAKSFEIFSQAVLQPTFPEEELSKLKPELLAQIEQMENSWHGQASRYFRSKFFTQSPYRRVSQGTAATVEGLTREQIAAFHEQTLCGSRAVLAIFGDIDVTAVEGQVREQFGGMPKGKALEPGSFAEEPAPTAARQFVERTPKTGATVYVGFPGMKLTNIEDRYAMDVLTEMIGSNNGWLHETLRKAQLVYYAWGFSFPGVIPGFVGATAQCEADKAPEVLSRIQELLAKAARGEFDEKEIALAKNNQINSEILQKQTNADAAFKAGLDELYGFGYDWSDGNADRIMAVSREHVQAAAKKYLSVPPTVTIVTSQPELFAKPAAGAEPAAGAAVPPTPTPAAPASAGSAEPN